MSWEVAGRALAAKTLAEFSYEGMFAPVACGSGWALDLDARWTFGAERGTFGSWQVDPATVRRSPDGPADARQLLLDAAPVLGWDGGTTADVLRELAATQAADVRVLAGLPTAAGLADLGHAELEGHLGGHPCMVLNKGRLGFSAADRDRYTPEARTPFRVRWVTVSPSLARSYGAVPERVPVHPWQWENVVAPLFAAEIAAGLIVDHGEGPDRYLPLQSVRTLANVDRPGAPHLKLALMIRNTLVWRGLSPADAAAGPAVSAWLSGLRDSDPYLVATGVTLLREVGALTVTHPGFDAVADVPYRLRELLGAIWREPLALADGERARSLAALLAVGSDGRALVTELVARSGLDAERWLAALLGALLRPLLHYLYAYGVAFTPHGENVIVVTDRDGIPARIALKDFGADIELVDGPDLPEWAGLPADVRPHLRRWPAEDLAHSILSALCAGHFRHFAPLVDHHLGVPADTFWGLVRAEVAGCHQAFPAYEDRFARFDLLGPTFARVCLNREQTAGAGFHERADRDGAFDLMDGRVANPLHA